MNKALLALLFVVFSPLALAEDGTAALETTETDYPAPNVLIKLRGLPIFSAIGSSANAERFNHSLWGDAEVFLGTQFSTGISVGHSRLSIGKSAVDSAGFYTDEFIKEWQLGVLATFYFSESLKNGSFYLRGHGFALLLDTETPIASANLRQIPVNRAAESLGLRTGLEAGFLIRGRNLWLDFGLGFSTYLKNPYIPFEGENQYGVPAEISNVFFGLTDVYPTMTASLGFSF